MSEWGFICQENLVWIGKSGVTMGSTLNNPGVSANQSMKPWLPLWSDFTGIFMVTHYEAKPMNH
jgi:hypothetical protein